MGWFWKSKDDGGGGSSDPLANLDPNLRAFLLKESPLKPSPATSRPSSSSSSSSVKSPVPPPDTSPSAREEEGRGANPRTRHSKYGDRYADIWEQYTPQGVTEASKSSQEQLADILQAYKYRKTLIGRAALENCSSEQHALLDCYNNAGIVKKMMACNGENRKLQDCYFTQTVRSLTLVAVGLRGG